MQLLPKKGVSMEEGVFYEGVVKDLDTGVVSEHRQEDFGLQSALIHFNPIFFIPAQSCH